MPDLLRAGDCRDRRHTARGERVGAAATLSADLPNALHRGDIRVHFQPQVRLTDGRVSGVEALARWDHPLLGPIDADDLFAAAGLRGLAGELSEHVQNLALQDAAAWPATLAQLTLSVNATALDLARDGFAASLLRRIARSGLAPTRVCVEVTEEAPIADLAAGAVTLQTLRDAGVRTAIDDFGAGYAGVAWLKALPFDRLKVDKSLIVDLAESARARALVRGVIALGAALNLDVVAEGVETAAQRAVLAEEGCGWFQGFLYAGAIDTSALASLVQDQT